MAFLRDQLDRLWNYVSPRKTIQRREKPFRIPAKPVRVAIPRQKQADVVTLDHERLEFTFTKEMSPESRVNTWAPHTSGEQGDIDATLLPPSPPTSAMQSHDDFEGDTLVPESPISPSYDKTGSPTDKWNANEDIKAVDDGTYMVQHKMVNVGAERRRREKQGRELRDAGWSQDSVFLFQKLGMRGFEPILPIDWINDFDSLPEDLFTAKLDKVFIKASQGSDYHAQVALSSLNDLGSIVRDSWLTRAPRTPEYHIKNAVSKYTKWAMRDGRIDRIWAQLPLFENLSFAHRVHSTVGEEEMIKKLGDLHALWQQALHVQAADDRTTPPIAEIPTLYGVISSHTVMAFVSYAPPAEENEKAQLRLIAMFDLGKEGYDVWNALAIAIFVIHCRNRMMQLREFLPEPEVSESDDPDL